MSRHSNNVPSLGLSILPVVALLSALITIIAVKGASAVQDYSYKMLLGASLLAYIISMMSCRRKFKHVVMGVRRSAGQILPAVPILIFIGTLSATWMMSGVVPTLIDYGLVFLDPVWFLALSCIVCAMVSVVTGSSWTTIATIGVALMGIGTVMGYSQAWVAGAIISGAYFGDKVSPLSDTTVLAASSCEVPLFTHIRFLMFTTIPAMTIALIVYMVVGFTTVSFSTEGHSMEMVNALQNTFNVTPWTLVIPAITCVMIAMRARTDLTLAVGSLTGLIGIFVFQPDIVSMLTGGDGSFASNVGMAFRVLVTETVVDTNNDLLDSLVSTGGVEGMLPTVWLVLSAMLFGGVMIGTGMLSQITHAITRHISKARSLVTATVGSGLFLNSCTGDQYLSIIIGGNVYRSTYRRLGMRNEVLSRSLEDSVSVTSVLIPWNSCGVTQSTVLGVATLAYLPCCVFNYLSPVMSIVIAWIGFRVRESVKCDDALIAAAAKA